MTYLEGSTPMAAPGGIRAAHRLTDRTHALRGPAPAAVPRRRATLLALILGLAATSLPAVDGVLEISHACAVNIGCFPGDSAGYPVTVSQPGSYRLTSNLSIPNEDTNGIQINASDVTLDLNGFAVIGPTVCAGNPPVCAPEGFGYGIFSDGTGVTIRNGSVRGAGNGGIRLTLPGSGCSVEAVTVSSNAGIGVSCGSDCLLASNRALGNGGTGLAAGANSQVDGNVARDNAHDGLSINSSSVIRNNTAQGNGLDGIHSTGKSVVEGNSLEDNGGDGIDVAFGSVVRGNSSTSNDGYGFRCAGAGYVANAASANSQTVTGCISLGPNLCNGALCP